MTVKSTCTNKQTAERSVHVQRCRAVKSLTEFLLKNWESTPGMQQPGPATKGNRVRQLHISCGSSPLTQPLISPAAAAQSPYLYLPGICVPTAEMGVEEGGWVCLSSGQWVEHPSHPHFFRYTSRLVDPCLARDGWQQNAPEQAVHTRLATATAHTTSNIQSPLSIHGFWERRLTRRGYGEVRPFISQKQEQIRLKRAAFPKGLSYEQDKYKACN